MNNEVEMKVEKRSGGCFSGIDEEEKIWVLPSNGKDDLGKKKKKGGEEEMADERDRDKVTIQLFSSGSGCHLSQYSCFPVSFICLRGVI